MQPGMNTLNRQMITKKEINPKLVKDWTKETAYRHNDKAWTPDISFAVNCHLFYWWAWLLEVPYLSHIIMYILYSVNYI